jgi:hypothetical protein
VASGNGGRSAMWLGIWTVAIALAIGLSVAAIAMQPKSEVPRLRR